MCNLYHISVREDWPCFTDGKAEVQRGQEHGANQWPCCNSNMNQVSPKLFFPPLTPMYYVASLSVTQKSSGKAVSVLSRDISVSPGMIREGAMDPMQVFNICDLNNQEIEENYSKLPFLHFICISYKVSKQMNCQPTHKYQYQKGLTRFKIISNTFLWGKVE